MNFRALPLSGAFVIDLEPLRDERGFFARSVCSRTLAERGLETAFPQSSISWNAKRGTLRGLHHQAEPHAEVKLVRCTRGAVFDVIVDLRAGSPTWGRWTAVTLSDENRATLYIPRGFAHGFQSLTDDAELLYQISTAYEPSAVRGIRWDDPRLAIAWPDTPERIVSRRDRELPLLGD